MLKKIKAIFKHIIIGGIWTYIYVSLFKICLIYFWNFNPFSISSWQIIKEFWNAGGSIKSGSDYMLFILILSFFPIWILGWKYLYKKNYIKLILLPITMYNQRLIKKYTGEATNITIKNMGVKGMKIEEQIEAKCKSIKSAPSDEEVNEIRSALQDKLSSYNKK